MWRETNVAGSETRSGSGVGAETSLKVESGYGVRSETNHFGSTTLDRMAVHTHIHQWR